MKRFLIVLVASGLLANFSYGSHALQHRGWLRPEAYQGPLGFMRDAFMSHLAGVSSDAKALVAGLAIGDKSALSSATAETMKVVSLTHLTAVSGANCAIVIGAVYLLLSRFALVRQVRLLLTLVALLGYILLVGPQPSVLRAGLMAAIVIGARAFGRNTSAMSGLSLAVIVLLVSNPWLAADYGFILSVLATIGILVLAPSLARRLEARLPRWLALALSVSVAAQLLCTPVLLQLQPGLSTYSIIANVLAEPLVAPVTVLGMLGCLVAPVFPFLTSGLTWLASLATCLIVYLADFLANAPSATISWPDGLLGAALFTGIAATVTVWISSTNIALRRVTASLLALVLSITLGSCASNQIRIGSWLKGGWTVISCDVGQGDSTLIRSQGLVALIDVGRKPRPVSGCLKELGIKTIDLLVLTHFDLDHVGGLDGALSVARVKSAIITSYRDERPAAAITYRKLRKAASQLIEAGAGLTGQLGQFTWKVLSPHQGAAEAEDSNDGSVTMLFESPVVKVLTLADLGEKGQMRLARESAGWLGNGFGSVPLVVKVSHHGSADQYPELYEALKPEVALISVGAHNDYGHPTRRTLDFLARIGSHVYRTDQLGSIAVTPSSEGLRVSTRGHG
jgi:competence protein ComEC